MKDKSTTYVSGSNHQTMSRAEFLRILGLGATGAAAVLAGLGRIAPVDAKPGAAGNEVDVYPTGVFPTDLKEVHAAINGGAGPSGKAYAGGGTVRLKATNLGGVPTYFNFGDGTYPDGRGTVEISRDVVIVGEFVGGTGFTFPAGRNPDVGFEADRTVIYGGKRPFACLPAAPVPARLAVRGIYFAYPSLAAVQVGKSAGLEVSDCVVYDVAWDATGVPTLPRVAVGIEATGGTGPDPEPNPDLFGEFRVVNNRIRRAAPSTSPPNYSFADVGIVLQRTLMNAQISANEVARFAFGGIGIDRNRGTATVVGNIVLQCAYGTTAASAGIGVRGTSLPVAIERNDVTCAPCGPTLPSRNGLFVASENVVVRGNSVHGAVVRDGILLSTFKPPGSPVGYRASGCRILSNRLDDLLAGHAQLSIAAECDANQSTNNDYGTVVLTSAAAGVVVASNDNQLVGEQFRGTYPGVLGSPAVPCIWLQPGSFGNRVTALHYRDAAPGAAVCEQIRNDGANIIPGYERCRRR